MAAQALAFRLLTGLLSGLIGWLMLVSPVYSSDNTSNAQQLEKVQAEIKQLKAWLKEAQSEYKGLQKELKESDETIAELSKEVTATQQRLAEEQRRLKKLRKEQAQQNLLRQTHQQYLSKQIHSANQLGNEAAVRFWLTQNDPTKNQRLIEYFGYFNRARISQIQETIIELERLNNLEKLISEQETKLKRTADHLNKEQQALTHSRTKQKKVLAMLNQQMSNESERLKTKQADQKRLEELLNQVTNLISESNLIEADTPFQKMRGKLPRPISGRVLNAFGKNNPENNLPWRGWRVRAIAGTPVNAIHYGRVVFSDWLRGFGLLLIIDHGNNYLSLYAHNETLLKDVGNWVTAGEAVATAGDSGGLEQPTLYFEIRHNGQPKDPAVWISRK